MKKTISPLLGVGLLVFAIQNLIDRFVTPVSDWIAIPVLVVAIVFIVVGGLKTREEK